MASYYNEFDKDAAAWLRQLIARGLIAPGDVDERSIVDVSPDDLRGYTQCHFFAGIGGWSYALRLAGVADDRPVWTGSCPCQPFSAAGKQRGSDDERHLWPQFLRLVRACRPSTIFGEQVAGRAGLIWFDGEGAYMPDMRDRAAVLGVLRQLQGQSPPDLQAVLRGEGAGAQAFGAGGSCSPPQGVALGETRLRLGQRGATSGEDAQPAVRLGPAGDSGGDRCGPLSSDGDRIRSDGAEGVERAVAGSNRAWCGLHEVECTGGPLCVERDGEHMGAFEDYADCVGDFGSPEGAQRALDELDRREAERSDDDARLASVRFQLEEHGYTVGAASIGAHSVGAPHIRQRLYWVAHRVANAERRASERRRLNAATATRDAESQAWERQRVRADAGAGVIACGVADSASSRCGQGRAHDAGRIARSGAPGTRGPGFADDGNAGVSLGDATEPRPQGRDEPGQRTDAQRAAVERAGAACCDPRGTNPYGAACECPWRPWRHLEWIACTDGKARPAQRGIQPLADGLPKGLVRGGDRSMAPDADSSAEGRVMRLRGYGNAIAPQVAAAFVRAAGGVFARTKKGYECALPQRAKPMRLV